MQSSNDDRPWSPERMRALLTAFKTQAPPEFEAQLLTRVYALQQARAQHAGQGASPRKRPMWSLGWGSTGPSRALWCHRPAWAMLGLCLLVVGTTFSWWVPTSRPADAPLQEGLASQRPTSMISRDVAYVATRSPYEAMASLAPVPPALDLASEHGTAQAFDARALPRTAGNPGGPEVATDTLPVVRRREGKKVATPAHEQGNGRQHGMPGKAKRPGKGGSTRKPAPA